MDALNNILNRVSARELAQPYPSNDEMKLVYQAALRAPDHAWLRPSSFIEVKDEGLDKLSKIFHEYALTLDGLSEEIINKYKNAPYRAPMIIILVSSFKEHPKVPAIEQKLSTATAAQNISLALSAMKYSCIWRTGKLAFNKSIQKSIGLNENQEIIGFIYVGTETGKKKQIPTLDIDEFVAYL